MSRPSVIKAGTALPLGRAAPRSFEVSDLMAEVRAATEAARAEASRVVAEARAQADTIREQARQEGHRAGYQKGFAEGRAAGVAQALAEARQQFAEQQRNLMASYQQAVQQIEDMKASWEAGARRDLIDLAMAIARRVAHHVGQRDRQVVQANIEEALRLVGASSDVTIQVHPVDAEAARRFASSVVAQQGQLRHVRVIETPEVSPGGCRVQHGGQEPGDVGEVDATIETQLDRIAAELGLEVTSQRAQADADLGPSRGQAEADGEGDSER